MLWLCVDSKQRNTDSAQTITAEMSHCSSRLKYPIEVLVFNKLLTVLITDHFFFLPLNRSLGVRPYR